MIGALYMFRGQMGGYVHADQKRIETRLAPMALIADTLDAQPGTAGDGLPEITPKSRLAVYLDQYI